MSERARFRAGARTLISALYVYLHDEIESVKARSREPKSPYPDWTKLLSPQAEAALRALHALEPALWQRLVTLEPGFAYGPTWKAPRLDLLPSPGADARQRVPIIFQEPDASPVVAVEGPALSGDPMASGLAGVLWEVPVQLWQDPAGDGEARR